MKNGTFPPRSILIVEDDLLLNLLTVDLVADAGFVTLHASNADEALAILESRPDIALLFTSIRMSGSMDGLELTDTVHNRWPTVKIIVASCLARRPEYNLPTGSRFLLKPYHADAVIAEIHSLIGPGVGLHGVASHLYR